MPLYLWYDKENESYTISSEIEEAPVGSQIILMSKERDEEIIKSHGDNPNSIQEKYWFVCENVKRKATSFQEQSRLWQRRRRNKN